MHKAVAQLSELFFPDSYDDAVDFDVKKLNKKIQNVKFGNNVLIGKKVKLVEIQL